MNEREFLKTEFMYAKKKKAYSNAWQTGNYPDPQGPSKLSQKL